MPGKKILLHVCCGPCACFPVKSLLEQGFEFTCFWFNPNIHPVNEFRLRLLTFKEFMTKTNVKAIMDESRNFECWLEQTRPGWSTHDKKSRCRLCYQMRLEKTAETALKLGFSQFSTTLLYSRYQFHDEVKLVGEEIAVKYKIGFYYSDFRTGWKDGIDLSKKAGLYRQTTCGCIFSINEAQDFSSVKQGK